MNIFKTFEIFLREPLSILKERFIQIVNIQADHSVKSSINADLLNKKTQITIVNNDKMYNLLRTVVHKQQMQKENINQSSNQKILIGQLSKRG